MIIIILLYNNNMPIHKTKLEFDPFHIDPEVLQKMDDHNKREKALRDKYLKMQLKLKKRAKII